MPNKKRLYKTKIGIPIWLVIGLCVFLLSSAAYEIYQDVMPYSSITSNLIVIIGALVVLIIALFFNFTSTKTIKKIFNGQMGGR